MFRKFGLPFGVAFFLAGLFLAGVPYRVHIEWGTSLGLAGEMIMMAGFVAFLLGAFFMWLGKGDWIKRTVRAELTHIMVLLQHHKRDKSHVNIVLHGHSTPVVKEEVKTDANGGPPVESAASELQPEKPLISAENKE